MSTEKRFAMVAVKKGFITKDQALKAITIQFREDMEGRIHRIIGAILVSQGYMTDLQVDKVLLEIIR